MSHENRIFRVTVFTFFFICVNSYSIDKNVFKADENSTIIENLEFKIIEQVDSERLPESFLVSLKAFGLNHRLKFIKNSPSNENFPLESDSILKYDLDSGKIIQNTDNIEPLNAAFYHDENDLCAVTLTKSEQEELKLLGTCYIGNHVYSIIPINLSHKRNKRNSNISKINPYGVFKRPNNYFVDTDFIKLDAELRNELKNFSNLTDLQEFENRTAVQLAIEILIVTDYSTYLEHKKITGLKDQKIILNYMRIYYSHLINGANFKYVNSFKDDPDLRLSLKIKNFLFSTSQNDSIWTNPKKVGIKEMPLYKNKEVILSDDTLLSFSNFLNSKKLNFTYDHAVGISNKDLWSSNQYLNNEQRSMNSGMAYFGRICSNKFKFSIVEDNGLLAGLTTLAHELGHNLGSDHDGQPGFYSNCSANDGYVMAPTVRFGLNNNKFSACSIQAIKNYLLNDGIPYNEFECLTDSTLQQETTKTSSLKLSDLWTPNEQCKIIHGKNSSFCQDISGDMCINLYCRENSTSDYCTSFGGALSGTTCASGKICKNGECLSEKDAKIGECLFGDDAVVRFYGTNEPLTCENFIEKSFNQSRFSRNDCINNQWIKNKCCNTCKVYRLMDCFDKFSNCNDLKDFCKFDSNIKFSCPKTCGLCSNKIKCESSKELCQNGGTCQNINTNNVKSFKCNCKKGFAGAYCEEKNPCEPNPCKEKKQCFRIGLTGHLCS